MSLLQEKPTCPNVLTMHVSFWAAPSTVAAVIVICESLHSELEHNALINQFFYFACKPQLRGQKLNSTDVETFDRTI